MFQDSKITAVRAISMGWDDSLDGKRPEIQTQGMIDIVSLF